MLMLHALMSASDIGYKLGAARWNALGWNVCFLHLPYHLFARAAGLLQYPASSPLPPTSFATPRPVGHGGSPTHARAQNGRMLGVRLVYRQ